MERAGGPGQGPGAARPAEPASRASLGRGDRGELARVARRLGMSHETVRTWVQRAEIDGGMRPGTTTDDITALVDRDLGRVFARHGPSLVRGALHQALCPHEGSATLIGTPESRRGCRDDASQFVEHDNDTAAAAASVEHAAHAGLPVFCPGEWLAAGVVCVD